MTNPQVTKEALIAAIHDISEGVVGTATALLKLIEEFGYCQAHIDALNNMNLKGSRFWVIWKDVCMQKPAMFIALIEDYLAGKFDWEDFEYELNILMECRAEHTAKGLRETYVHPAVHRFLENGLKAALEVPS